MRPDYYENKLYPLQDLVLRAVEKAETDFYLTGGTALSRVWLHHRYSDDLDFFQNRSQSFAEDASKLFAVLNKTFDNKVDRLIDTADFHRWVLTENDINLKIELINDIEYRRGKPEKTELFFKTDNVLNILSNKISALNRNEPKDIADIIYIDEHFSFSWPEMIEDAKQKDLSVNEIEIADAVGNYDVSQLDRVRWIQKPDENWCKQKLEDIARRILRGEGI